PSGQTSSVNSLPDNGSLFSTDEISKASNSSGAIGQQTNDVGNTVIVPKDGESFADTMRRAAAHGGTVQQSDIEKTPLWRRILLTGWTVGQLRPWGEWAPSDETFLAGFEPPQGIQPKRAMSP